MAKRLKPDQYLDAIQFSERMSDAALWVRHAEELLASAHILEGEVRQHWAEVSVEGTRVVSAPSRPSPQGAYFLLVAYALENYFKAVLIHRNVASFRNHLLPCIPDYLKQHDLVKLAKKTGFGLDVSEEELLTRLTRSSTWAARYPVPTDSDALRAIKKLSDGRAYLTAYLAPGDVDRINTFVRRLSEFAHQELGESHDRATGSKA
jgi:hypothetical protein